MKGCFRLVGRIDDNAARRIDEHSWTAKRKADDWKLCGHRLENYKPAGIVQAREDESSMAEISGCNFVVREPVDPIDMRGYTTFFGNSPEPASILPLANHRQARIGKTAQNFGHRAEHKVQAFPVEEASYKEKSWFSVSLRQWFSWYVCADCGQHQAFRMKAPWHAAEGFRCCAGNQCGFREGPMHERVVFYGVDEQIAQSFLKPPRKIQPRSQRVGRCLSAANRAKDKWNSQASHKRRLAKRHKGDVVHHIKWIACANIAGAAVCPVLPKQVVEVQSTRPVLKTATPRRKVIIDRFDLEVTFGEVCLYYGPVILARNQRDVMPQPRESQQPIPAHSRLGAFTGLTRIRGQEDLHGPELRTAPTVLDNFIIWTDAHLAPEGSQ